MLNPMTDRVTRVRADERVREAMSRAIRDEYWLLGGESSLSEVEARSRAEESRAALIAAILTASDSLSVPPGETPTNPQEKQMSDLDLLEQAWGVIANVTPWSEQNKSWQSAAMRWRDAYHARLKSYVSSPLPEPQAVSDLARRVEEAREGLTNFAAFGIHRFRPSKSDAECEVEAERMVLAYRDSLVALTEARCRGEREADMFWDCDADEAGAVSSFEDVTRWMKPGQQMEVGRARGLETVWATARSENGKTVIQQHATQAEAEADARLAAPPTEETR